MAISAGDLVNQTDINSIFTAFNSFISQYGGTISQIASSDIPQQGGKVDDATVTILNNKIDQFNADEYLKTKDWWTKADISEGDLIKALSFDNIITTVDNFSRVQCRNQATNNYSTNGNCCNSNDKSVSCSHSTNGNCCNSNNKSVSCSHSTNGNCCNSNNKSVSCSNGKNGNCCNSNNKSVSCSHGANTVGHTCSVSTPCQFFCSQNPENCTWQIAAYWIKTTSGGPHAWAGFTVTQWACCQYSNCQYGCLYYANTYSDTRYPVCSLWCSHRITCSNTCSQSCANSNHGQTCGNTCNQSCSNSNHGQTCGNTCNQSCANSNHGQTCSNTCSQSCANTNYNQTCAHTQTIDIACQNSTNSNN